MDQQPLISVIVPVFNTAAYLARCLDSLICQTYSNIEILAVNDGSTDESASILSDYAGKDPRIRVFTQENRGLSAARNTALDAARGDWLMFLDSDDFAGPSFCETPLSAALTAGADMVLFNATGLIEKTGVTFPFDAALPEGIYSAREILMALASSSIHPNVWIKLYRRDLFDGIRFPEGENWEDCAIMHLVIDRASRICAIRDALCTYLQREKSITKMAQRDLSIYYWRYHQYNRRYAYLLEHYPDIAAGMAPSQEDAALKYCAVCALMPALSRSDSVSGGSVPYESFASIRAQILGGKTLDGIPIPHSSSSSFPVRAGRILLRLCPPLFRLAAGKMLHRRHAV